MVISLHLMRLQSGNSLSKETRWRCGSLSDEWSSRLWPFSALPLVNLEFLFAILFLNSSFGIIVVTFQETFRSKRHNLENVWKQAVFVESEWHILFIFNSGTRTVENIQQEQSCLGTVGKVSSIIHLQFHHSTSFRTKAGSRKIYSFMKCFPRFRLVNNVVSLISVFSC